MCPHRYPFHQRDTKVNNRKEHDQVRDGRTNNGVLNPSSIECHPISGGRDRGDQATQDGKSRPKRGHRSESASDCRSPNNLVYVEINGDAPIQWVQRADIEEGDERVRRHEQKYGDEKCEIKRGPLPFIVLGLCWS